MAPGEGEQSDLNRTDRRVDSWVELRLDPLMLTGPPFAQSADVGSALVTLGPVIYGACAAIIAVGVWVRLQMRAYRRRVWATQVALAVRAKDFDALAGLASSRELAGWVPAFEDVLEELRETLQRDGVRRDQALHDAKAHALRFRRASVPALTLRDGGLIVGANDEACWLLGRVRSELIGVPLDDLLCERDSLLGEHQRYEWLRGQFSYNESTSEVYGVRRANRRDAVVLVITRSLESSDTKQSKAVEILDVTDLVHPDTDGGGTSDGTSARLAGSVALDLNDRLTTVLAHAYLLRERHHEQPEMLANLDALTSAAEQARTRSKQWMALSRADSNHATSLELNGAIRTALPKLGVALGGTGVDLQLSTSDLWVHTSFEHIEEILIHLLQNASESMDGAGTVCVETYSDIESKERGAAEGVIRMRVLDDGKGLGLAGPGSVFSTPTATNSGREMGLGLGSVRRLVKYDGGDFQLNPRASGGTCAEVTWPVHCPESARDVVASRAQAEHAMGAGQRIVLVDDDEPVRRVLCDVLTGAGYEVSVAAGFEQAQSIFQAQGEHVDLLVTDILMPLMTGSQLYETLRSTYPDLRVLYMSGHVDRDVFRGSQPWNHDFLQKPFRPAELLQAVAHRVAQGADRTSGRRILLIGEQDETRAALVDLLDALKIEHFPAIDGAEALSLLGRMSVDAIISDLSALNVEAITACAEIHRRHPDLRIIAMTDSRPTSHSMHTASSLGANSTLRKPFGREDVCEALATAFGD